MQAVADTLDLMLNGDDAVRGDEPRTIDFVLLLFPYGDKSGRCNYIASVSGEDIRNIFREQLKAWTGP